ncbi:MAG TPA: hypothetical protein VGP54_00800 [Gaiellaceae bacterium]|jgi:hypothetical protein|nr:hypothetical protein [Gaiellaceae bacterium]
MAARNQQTHAKRARELAVKEKRERKRAKKAEHAALRAAGIDPFAIDPEIGISDDADGVENESEAEAVPEETA